MNPRVESVTRRLRDAGVVGEVRILETRAHTAALAADQLGTR